MANTIYNYPYGDLTGQFNSLPGSNLDMTKFSSPFWIESQHTRWDNSFPRKMGGEELLYQGTDSITRKIYTNIIGNKKRTLLFQDKKIIQIDSNSNNEIIAITNRTPANFEEPDINYNFSVAEFPLTIETPSGLLTEVYIFFVALNNVANINNDEEQQIYYGRLDLNTPFEPYYAAIDAGNTPILQKTSGGVIVTGQRLFIFGNYGIVKYTERNNFNIIGLNNYAAEGSLKFVTAWLFRTGMLLWSANTLYFAQFTTTGLIIQIASSGISIISPNCVIDGRNSTFYWMGLNQFFMYNGAIQPLPNNMNRNYLFQTLNQNYKGNIWGMYVENFTEFWWFAPTSNSECDLLTIFNTTENTWYNTRMKKSAGLSAGVIDYPLTASNSFLPNSPVTLYPIWLQEKGVNQKIGEVSYPIEAYVKTKLLNIFDKQSNINTMLRLRRLEKDIRQEGDMILEIETYRYPESEPESVEPIVFTPETTNINLNIENGLISMKFISNTIDGFFQFGKLLIDFENGSPRP